MIEGNLRLEVVVPTIFRVGSYRFYFWSHEPNEPPHVHIDSGLNTAKFWLKDAELADSLGFSKKELNKLQTLVVRHKEQFLDQWYEYFGT